MFTTWSASNRIVKQPLMTSYTREIVPVASYSPNNYAKSYFLYTRIRRKKYSYVGMDKATAVQCAMAMNLLYNRFVPNDWLWDGTNYHGKWVSYADPGPTNHTWGLWRRQTCASVAITKESKDDRYTVDIDVDEELPYRFACVQSSTSLVWADTEFKYWNEFEENPDIVTPRFATGKDYGVDFTYDE